MRIHYEICPECGFANLDKKGACPACDNRLFSDGDEEHLRYVKLVRAEHTRRTWQWYGGWCLVALILLWPLAVVAVGRKVSWMPGAGILVGAMVLAWHLIDLKKKRDASRVFLAKHANA